MVLRPPPLWLHGVRAPRLDLRAVFSAMQPGPWLWAPCLEGPALAGPADPTALAHVGHAQLDRTPRLPDQALGPQGTQISSLMAHFQTWQSPLPRAYWYPPCATGWHVKAGQMNRAWTCGPGYLHTCAQGLWAYLKEPGTGREDGWAPVRVIA